MSAMLVSQISKKFRMDSRTVVRLLRDSKPVKVVGKQRFYDSTIIKRVIDQRRLMPKEPPEGCVAITYLHRHLGTRPTLVQELREQPNFPKPDGFYLIEQNNGQREIGYYDTEKFIAWFEQFKLDNPEHPLSQPAKPPKYLTINALAKKYGKSRDGVKGLLRRVPAKVVDGQEVYSVERFEKLLNKDENTVFKPPEGHSNISDLAGHLRIGKRKMQRLAKLKGFPKPAGKYQTVWCLGTKRIANYYNIEEVRAFYLAQEKIDKEPTWSRSKDADEQEWATPQHTKREKECSRLFNLVNKAIFESMRAK